MAGKAVVRTTPKALHKWFEDHDTVLASRIEPLGVDPVRMARAAVLSLTQNPKLGTCSPESFVLALIESAFLKLEPSGVLGQAYLVPYGGQARLQIGYRGLVDLAQRGGTIGAVYASPVYEKDDWDFDLGTQAYITHRPYTYGVPDPLSISTDDLEELGNAGSRICFYAKAHFMAGGKPAIHVMPLLEVEKIRRGAASFRADTSPWITHYDAMGSKTVLRALLWRGIRLSVELQAALVVDQGLERGEAYRLHEASAEFQELKDITDELGLASEEEEEPQGKNGAEALKEKMQKAAQQDGLPQ